ncbi:MAG: barrel protein, partial [Mucilaginibacter sp.]|nr:barrel protein [Mucilaginibacter sp.]
MTSRRDFIKKAAIGAAGIGLAAALPEYLYAETNADLFFKFAISQFSFASEFWTKQLDPLDFAAKSKGLGISGLDYCSMFFADKAKDQQFLGELKKRASDNGSYNLRIMVDGEGVLGDLT